MDVSRFVTESAAFTRATLSGRPSRWLVFILLGLPWMALSSLLEGNRILEGNVVHWGLVPWREAGLLIAAGLLCNLLLWGWIVRLFRNNPAPPEFDNPLLLCLDGIKVHTIPLVWMLVPTVLAYAEYSIAGSGTVSLVLWPPDPAMALLLALIVIQLLILIYALQYGLIGAIRFARTGSMAEAFNLPEIRRTAARIGFVNYYLGFAVVAGAWLLFSLLLRGITLVPSAGPFISLCLSPVPVVFCSRFVAHFCDEDPDGRDAEACRTPDPASPVPVLSGRAMAAEFLFWLAILSAFTVLCFTPMVLVVASLTRYIP
jgi:hypothetical protein